MQAIHLCAFLYMYILSIISYIVLSSYVQELPSDTAVANFIYNVPGQHTSSSEHDSTSSSDSSDLSCTHQTAYDSDGNLQYSSITESETNNSPETIPNKDETSKTPLVETDAGDDHIPADTRTSLSTKLTTMETEMDSTIYHDNSQSPSHYKLVGDNQT